LVQYTLAQFCNAVEESFQKNQSTQPQNQQFAAIDCWIALALLAAACLSQVDSDGQDKFSNQSNIFK
jgi:hypothetical protein